MYVYRRQVTMQRGIATLLAIALVLWGISVHMFTSVEAANLTYVKNTLSDSDSNSLSSHTIEFVLPAEVDAGETVTVTFPAGFTGTGTVLLADVDFEVNGVDETVVAGAPGATEWGLSTSSSPTFTFTAGASESIATSATVTIKIGASAGGGTNRITNPSATTTSYEFSLTASPFNSGQTRVAITDNVTVTANVDTSLTFVVSGTTTGVTVNGSPTTTASTTYTNLLPFGTLTNNVSKTLGQDLTLATNARNGYVVTVAQDANLLSSTGADIDAFVDGSFLNAPAAWSGPGNNVADENTWGHWGMTSNDPSLLGAGNDFTSNTWVAVSTSPRAIMAHSGPSDGTTLGVGRATMGYQAQITALQEAGDDYSTVLTYIATPTF